MRIKTILSVASFIAAFAASAAFASLFITKTQTVSQDVPVVQYNTTSCFKYKNNSATADKIAALIRQDKTNERESGLILYREGNIERPSFASPSFPYFAETVERYVDASSIMKASDLPGNFDTEWREHMKAWRAYSKFLNRMKDTPKPSGWTDEELKEVDDFHSREIKRTWQTVLHIGATHGANVR